VIFVAGQFLDSNILIYAFTTDARAAKAQALLGGGCTTSVQGLNEFANVARRKLGMNWKELKEALAAIRVLCRTIVSLDIATHDEALRLAERHGFTFFDSLIVASALGAGCDTLWSEDLQDGSVVDGRLRIANPFRVP
jgi:predicted nucleic acid-binding protein